MGNEVDEVCLFVCLFVYLFVSCFVSCFVCLFVCFSLSSNLEPVLVCSTKKFIAEVFARFAKKQAVIPTACKMLINYFSSVSPNL